MTATAICRLNFNSLECKKMNEGRMKVYVSYLESRGNYNATSNNMKLVH